MEKGTDFWSRALEEETKSRAHRGAPTELRVPALTVIYHPDVERIGQRATLPSTPGAGIDLSRAAPVFGGSDTRSPGPLADPFLSRKPWRLSATAQGGLGFNRNGSSILLRVGGSEVQDTLSLSRQHLQDGVVLELEERIVLALHLASPVPYPRASRHGLVGNSDAIGALCKDIERLANLRTPVLLRGESGTGKELAARAIHDAGPWREGPFVAVNMAAVPVSLAASELFGTERGAFTGADQARKGFFQAADGGTLFLDEIGDTPSDAQALLLRALETGEVQAVGAASPRSVKVRVIAATDLDLEAAIKDGRFRTPLFHRLNGFELVIPPLRRRIEDLGLLLRLFLLESLGELGKAGDELRKAGGEPGKTEHLQLASPDGDPWLPAELVAKLSLLPWPGNVRQLRNVARQLVAAGHDLQQAVIPESVTRLFQDQAAAQNRPEPVPAEGPRARRPAEISDDEVVATLRRHGWRIKPAADALGISRPSLYKRMAESSRFHLVSDLDESVLRQAYKEVGGRLSSLVDRLEVSPDALKRRFRELGLEVH